MPKTDKNKYMDQLEDGECEYGTASMKYLLLSLYVLSKVYYVYSLY